MIVPEQGRQLTRFVFDMIYMRLLTRFVYDMTYMMIMMMIAYNILLTSIIS